MNQTILCILKSLLVQVMNIFNYNNELELPSLTTILIGNGAFKKAISFSVNNMKAIETIEIGDGCFKEVKAVSIDHLPVLHSIKIGMESFTQDFEGTDIKTFRVYNCSKLVSIEIGEYSFSDFKGTFTLSDLPSLQILWIGSLEHESNNFRDAEKFSISSI